MVFIDFSCLKTYLRSEKYRKSKVINISWQNEMNWEQLLVVYIDLIHLCNRFLCTYHTDVTQYFGSICELIPFKMACTLLLRQYHIVTQTPFVIFTGNQISCLICCSTYNTGRENVINRLVIIDRCKSTESILYLQYSFDRE